MTSFWSRSAFSAALVGAVVLWASLAQAQEPNPGAIEEAREHFRHGVELHQSGELDAAHIEFKKAHELAPNYQVLFNIGQTAFALGYWGEAHQALSDYLEQGGERIVEERRNEVLQRLEQLKSRVGYAVIDCARVGAELILDGKSLGECPAKHRVVMSVGRHKVVADSAEGASTRTVDVAVGEEVLVVFRAPEKKKEEPPPATEPLATTQVLSPPESQDAALSTRFWVGIAASGAMGVGALTTGIVAMGQNNEAKRLSGVWGADTEAINRANRRARNFALTSDILLGAAAITLGTTVALEFTLREDNPDADRAARTLKLTVDPKRVRLSTTF